MNKKRSHFVPAFSDHDSTLERRLALSGVASASELPRAAADVSALAARNAATRTTLTVSAGTLGQPIGLGVTVSAAASAGSPVGTVNILDHGQVIASLSVSPSASTNPRFASSSASATLEQPPGGAAYYFGRHSLTAVFVPAGSFARSKAARAFTVGQPSYTSLTGGVEVATTADGSGPAIQSGQTANVLYTGYLARNGRIFDDSINDGGSTLGFSVGAGQVVPGFDSGVAGMRVGEARIIVIPPAEGYGATANGPIPANSTLIFVVTLKSIS